MPSRIFQPGLLDGQVAVVTGGGSGLGRATALELSALGARVVVCGRRAEPLEETAAAAKGGRVEALVCDIREEEQVDVFVSSVLERHGRIDLLVNNAGGQYMTPAEDITPKGFRTVIRLNALAAGHFGTETLLTKYPAAVVEGVAGTVPLQRLGTEEEFAWLVAFLASPAGGYFSGAVLTIAGPRDNGLGVWPPGGLPGGGGKPLAEERRPKE